MSASTLLSKTPLPRVLSDIYAPAGGAPSGVTSLNAETGDLTITAGTGVSVTTPAANEISIANTGVTSIIAGSGIGVSSATGDVTVTSTVVGTTPSVFVDGFTGVFPTSVQLTGSTFSKFSGGGYAPGTLTAGKTYLVTGTIEADFLTAPAAIPNPGGHWSASLFLNGAPDKKQDVVTIQIDSTAVNGLSEHSFAYTFIAPATYGTVDVIVTQTTVDPGTVGIYTLQQWAVTQLN